ncbi:MAG: NAD(P)-dependent alcohol dehydrogenase [Nannocystaceae bacterium]
MQAAIHHQFGAPQVLQMQEVEPPAVGDDQILVQVHASPVTQGDRRLRAADFPGIGAVVGRLMFGVLRPRYPIPGTMFAGKVVAVGPKVTRFSVGDDVFGSCDSGAQAEYLAVGQDSAVATIPEGIGYDEAAATPYGAGTALGFLRDVAKVQAGERVLIVGAAGGVGRFAVQIARHLGAHVTGVCRGRDAAMVTELGAHEVIDYTQQDYTRGGEIYDVIFDTASGDGFRTAKASLSERGRYVTLYMNLRTVFQMLVTAILGGPKVAASVVVGSQALTQDVAELLACGAIWPVIGARLPLARIADAHARLETGGTAGAVVVSVSDAVRSGARRDGPTDELAAARLKRTA